MPRLSEKYCTITLSGAHLGMTQNLEQRVQTGYLEVFRTLIDEIKLQSGDSVLDVGCGTGALDRWLVQRSGNEIHVTGVDINTYMLREAKALASKDGLEESLAFVEGEEDGLPFPDDHFDVVISCLSQLKMLPQLTAYSSGLVFQSQQSQAVSVLSEAEAEVWRSAVTQAGETFFIAVSYHCAVGTKL